MSPQDTQDTLIGRTLGRFEIVRELGRGAMGIVYEARDPAIGRRVAIKTVKTDPAIGVPAEVMERFRREASAAGALSHQNIVTVYDVGEQEGIVYIAMEFLDGRPLDEVLAEQRCLPIDECIELVAQVLDGLGHAHEHGVVHRDVKPANIVINDNGVAKVADFGIAHTVDSTLTRTGTLIGTPNYMSPEQFAAGHIDGRSDLFSAAVILYELLTGERAFHGDNLSTMMHNVMNVEPVPVRKVNLHVPEPLAAVIEKAMSKDPLRRYQTAADFAAALRESIKQTPDPYVLKLDPLTTSNVAKTVVSPAETVVAAPDVIPADETVTRGGSLVVEPAVPEEAQRDARSRASLVIMAALAAAALAAGCFFYYIRASAGMPMATLSVSAEEVLDMITGKSRILEGVTVSISRGEGQKPEIIGITTMSKEVPVGDGKCTLHFEKAGFSPDTQTVFLEPGQTTEVVQALIRDRETPDSVETGN